MSLITCECKANHLLLTGSWSGNQLYILILHSVCPHAGLLLTMLQRTQPVVLMIPIGRQVGNNTHCTRHLSHVLPMPTVHWKEYMYVIVGWEGYGNNYTQSCLASPCVHSCFMHVLFQALRDLYSSSSTWPVNLHLKLAMLQLTRPRSLCSAHKIQIVSFVSLGEKSGQ